MISTRFARNAIAVAMLVIGARTAHAQQSVQAFEDKYGPARTPANMVQLPTFGIGPAGTSTLDADVAEELTEAIQREMAVAQETRFEISARPSTGGKVIWALVVRDTPRAVDGRLNPGRFDGPGRRTGSGRSPAEERAARLHARPVPRRTPVGLGGLGGNGSEKTRQSVAQR